MTDFTPGPYVNDPFNNGIVGDISTVDGECVAQAQQVLGDDANQTKRRANARFLAAAPELLESLKAARKSLVAYGAMLTVAEIDAAIAKATETDNV